MIDPSSHLISMNQLQRATHPLVAPPALDPEREPLPDGSAEARTRVAVTGEVMAAPTLKLS
jgi:hypothetical protein